MIIGVLMEAQFIPDGSVVTKKTGEKIYTISSEIRIFGVTTKDNIVIPAKDGARFISHGHDHNVVAPETILVWRASDEEILELLEPQYED